MEMLKAGTELRFNLSRKQREGEGRDGSGFVREVS